MNAKGPCHQCRTDGQKRRQPHPTAPASEKCKAGQHVEKSGDEVEPQKEMIITFNENDLKPFDVDVIPQPEIVDKPMFEVKSDLDDESLTEKKNF